MKFSHNPIELPYTDLEAHTGENGRVYLTPDGDYPSITTVLSILSKDGIEAWRKKVGEEEADRISREAANRGTRIHEHCENYLNNVSLQFTFPKDRYTFNRIRPVIDKYVDNIRAQEVPLYSKTLSVAGRVDCIADWDGKLSIIDFKTSRKPKKKKWIEGYFMQETFYAIAFEELTGLPVQQIVTLVAVDNAVPQVFIEPRSVFMTTWAQKLIDVVKEYHDTRNIDLLGSH